MQWLPVSHVPATIASLPPVIVYWQGPLLFLLATVVLAFACFGVYTENNSPFDVALMLTYGIASYLLFTSDYERYLLLMAFVFGPWLQENIERFSARGDMGAIVNRPIAVMLIAAGAILVIAIGAWRKSRKANAARR